MIKFKNSICIYIIVSFFLFFEMAVQVSPGVMAFQIMHDLHIGALGLGVMAGLYFYTYTAMQIPSGLLFDRFHPRLIIFFSIIVCSIGTLIFSAANNVFIASIARLLMGTGSAFAFVAVLVVTADLFHSKFFALLTGITQMLAAFGAMSGQIPVSALVNLLGWRDTVRVLSIVGFILAIIVWKAIRYDKNQNLNYGDNQLVDVRASLKEVLKSPQTWFVAIYACLLWAPMSGFASLWGVPFIIKYDHLSQNSAAFVCSFMWLGLALLSPLIGAFSTAINNRVAPLFLSSLLGVVSFYLVLHFKLSLVGLSIALFFAGSACAGQALSFSVVKENNHPSLTGTAIAFNNMAVVISGAIFQPLIGGIIEHSKLSSLAEYSVTDFKRGLLLLLLAYIGSFLIALMFIREKKVNLNVCLKEISA